MFINLVESLYRLKDTIQGVKIVVAGPFNRHGRTHLFYYHLGFVVFNSYDSRILYDMVHCPTYFGMISFKIWIYYKKDMYFQKSKQQLIAG